MAKDGLVVDIERCHPDAEIPEYQNPGDAGMDLKAVEKKRDNPFHLWFKTGLKISVPKGYVGLIYPRSSISKKDLFLANSVGVIDSGYTGEIEVRFRKLTNWVGSLLRARKIISRDLSSNEVEDRLVRKAGFVQDNPDDFYRVGDRVAQLIIMPYPKILFREAEDLEDSERGSQGFGSTDNK